MKNGDEDDEEDEDEDEDDDDDDGEGERRRKREAKGKEQTQTWTPDTCALALITLKIMVGCLCRGPSSTHKNMPNGSTLWSVFQDGSNATRKKSACDLLHHKRC